jgi:hypothetical protein
MSVSDDSGASRGLPRSIADLAIDSQTDGRRETLAAQEEHSAEDEHCRRSAAVAATQSEAGWLTDEAQSRTDRSRSPHCRRLIAAMSPTSQTMSL